MITYPTNKLQKVLLSGGCRQSNLPEGYEELEYLSTFDSGGPYIDTGVKVGSKTRVVTKYKCFSLFFASPCSVRDTNTAGAGYGFGLNGSQQFISDYNGNRKIFENITPNTTDIITVDKNRNVCTITIGGQSETVTNTASTFETNGTLIFFGQRSTGTISASRYIFYSFKLWTKDVLVLDLVPARRLSDNELGFYNKVNGGFLTNAGTGAFTAGSVVTPTPDTPMDIVCNNGVLKLTKWNQIMKTFTAPLRINVDNSSGSSVIYQGTVLKINSTNLTTEHKMYINVDYTINTRYTNYNGGYIYMYQSYRNGQILPRVAVSKTTGRYIYKTIIADKNTSYTSSNIYLYLNVAAGCKYDVTIHSANIIDLTEIYGAGNEPATVAAFEADYKAKFGKAFDYEAYNAGYDRIYAEGTNEVITDNNGNTAGAVNLLGVGSYKDTHSILDGKVTRNFGIKVLNGTENWSVKLGFSNTYFEAPCSNIRAAETYGICSHFPCITISASNTKSGIGVFADDKIHLRYNSLFDATSDNVPALKAWLASEYAKGTPVILVGRLVDSTTEQVTPQPLAGNTATVTAGSIDNLPIESSTIAELKKRYIGDKEIKRVYIGSNLVWNAE